MTHEIETLEALDAHLARHRSLAGTVCQGLDLLGVRALDGIAGTDAAFLGCQLDAEVEARLIATGALVFPRLPDLPYRPYRPTLYTIDELMAGYVRGKPNSFEEDAADSAIYRHFQGHRESASTPILEALAQRLHDHAIDNALTRFLEDKRVVAIMGGHALRRDTSAYRDVALVARTLARHGYLVATGGGPGAMEAGNLGAWLAGFADDALETALAELAIESDYRADGYLEPAFSVRDRFPGGTESLAIPTWFYGHEPTNLFASHIAKYFANSLREDGLLAIATHGVIYAPGSAGTVQEVFMDLCQNHYVTFGVRSPMVFLGRAFWTEDHPVAAVVDRLANKGRYADMIAFVDDPDAAVDAIIACPPRPA